MVTKIQQKWLTFFTFLGTKNASNHKMSENKPLPNIPTDSKTTFGIFKTQKSNSKMTP